MITEKLGRNLHQQKNHPIRIVKNEIHSRFCGFQVFDDFGPKVSVEDNFDKLLIPRSHPSRRTTDTYYVDNKTVLRTHTSAHQNDLLSKGFTRFLVTGDVYRKCDFDKFNYPVFHQMDGVCICSKPEGNLHQTIRGLLARLFPDYEIRCSDSYFHFTDPSWEYEVQLGNQGVEVLRCGVIREKIIDNCGLNGEEGWAFGLGLDRIAMILFDIPDIRFLWSNDQRFLNQFSDERMTKFGLFLHQPSRYKDVSFWVAEGFNYNVFCEILREIGGDSIESITEIDNFVNQGRGSRSYRIAYRSIDRILTDEEIDKEHDRIRRAIDIDLKCELM